ncbi:hypothetical protein VL14_04415 [Cytobacillus firmus]|nr:hypothetical protein VL14_04415 [Cytobacillus firmus]
MKRKRTSKFVMVALLPMIVFKVPVVYKGLIRCPIRLAADGTCFHQIFIEAYQLFNNMASLLDNSHDDFSTPLWLLTLIMILKKCLTPYIQGIRHF